MVFQTTQPRRALRPGTQRLALRAAEGTGPGVRCLRGQRTAEGWAAGARATVGGGADHALCGEHLWVDR